ncbi:hypothetical protein AGR4A_pAt10486 [Agrobacterium tumefaciens str. B6]|uniref:Uncharacterized protein n=1 Tax=Agrobacterium tumefaciens str. B6 TaxID=1183423 RepID=A0A822VBV2_AGRTU|nr:hypothetical protein AGR4A_pAt10486 [Agrobacterium tumefaciens str. B6]
MIGAPYETVMCVMVRFNTSGRKRRNTGCIQRNHIQTSINNAAITGLRFDSHQGENALYLSSRQLHPFA